MRLEKEIIKQGYWWLPDKPNNKKVGTLQIVDGGEISLNLIGVFDDPLEQTETTEIHFGVNSITTYEKIEGVLEDGEYVVLENCYNKNSSFRIGRGLSKSVVGSRFAFVGEAVDRIKEVKFSKVVFSIEGIHEWLYGFSGIETNFKWDDESKKITGGEVHFEIPKSLNFELENGLKLSFDISIKTNSTSNFSEVNIFQEKTLEIDFQEAIELTEIIGIINRVRNFFCFSIDKRLSIKLVKLFVDGTGDQSNYVNLYYKSQLTERNAENFDVHQMLFHFGEIIDCFPKILNNWLKYHEILEPAFNLYFSVIYNNPTLQTRFLLIAHSLELFHRQTSSEKFLNEEQLTLLKKLLKDAVKDQDDKTLKDWVNFKFGPGADEIFLKQRIRRLTESFESYFGSAEEIDTFVKTFGDTRNYLTHYSSELEEKACKGEDLYNLSNKAEALLQIHLLKLIEFPEDKFEEVINRGITRKISQKATFV